MSEPDSTTIIPSQRAIPPSAGGRFADGSGGMFDRIAARYDLLNRILSLSQDRRWRRRAAAAIELRAGDRVLDVATGTGDLALEIAAAMPTATVLGLDPSPGMLAVARRKLRRRHLEDRVTLQTGVGERLPFADAAFTAATIAFGIRNIPDRRAALEEMARVVRPGRRVVVLELTEPERGALGPLARFHVEHLVPGIGALLSGAAEYRYLQRSIAAFPAPAEFARQMEKAGLLPLAVEPLTFGVAHLFVAEVEGGRS